MIDEEKQTIFIQLMRDFAQTYGKIDVMSQIDFTHLHPLLQDESPEALLSLLAAHAGKGYEIRDHYLLSPDYDDRLHADIPLSLYEFPSPFPLRGEILHRGETQQLIDLYHYCSAKSEKKEPISSAFFYAQMRSWINSVPYERQECLLSNVIALFAIEEDNQVVTLFQHACAVQPSWFCAGKSRVDRVNHPWQERCIAQGELTLKEIDSVVKFAKAAVAVYGFISIKDAHRILKGYALTRPLSRELFAQILQREDVDCLMLGKVLISEKLYTPHLDEDLSEEERTMIETELGRDFDAPIDVNFLKYYLLAQKMQSMHETYTVLPKEDLLTYARNGVSLFASPSFQQLLKDLSSLSSFTFSPLLLSQKLESYTNLIDTDLLLKKILEDEEMDEEEEQEEVKSEDSFAQYMYDEEDEVALDADESAMITDFFLDISHDLHLQRITDVQVQTSAIKLIPFILAEAPSWLYKGQSAMHKVQQIMHGNFEF